VGHDRGVGANTPLLATNKLRTSVYIDFITFDEPNIRVGLSVGTDASFCSGTAWFVIAAH